MRIPVWRRKQKEELDEEVRAHLEAAIRERIERGESREQAEAAARRAFGNIGLVQEVTRDVWGWASLDRLAQDVRYGLRMLRRAPGFTAVAVLTLALGIGANTAIFSVVNAVMLRPLPYRDPGQLAMLWTDDTKRGLHEEATSFVTYTDWRAQSRHFADLALFGGNALTLTSEDEMERTRGEFVSAHLFNLLGVQPILGRSFSAGEELRGEHVVILSHGLWQRRFGGSPDALGKTLTIDGDRNSWKSGPRTVRIIGVMPAGFCFPGKETQLWEPITVYWRWQNESTDRFHNRWGVVGRLKPGVTVAQAQAEMTMIGQRLAQDYPSPNAAFPGFAVRVVPLLDQITGRNLQLALWLLLGAVGFVLLIACVNVANLLLARGAVREREFAVRAALGAGRMRLLRQLFTESLLLAAGGGAVGLGLAAWLLGAAAALAPSGIPRLDEVSLDASVLLFTAAASLAAGLLFGLAPAWKMSWSDPHEALKEGGGSASRGPGLRYTRGALVVVECALAAVLLTGAGVLIRSFLRLHAVKPGYDPQNVLLVRVKPTPLVDTPPTRAMLQEVRMATKNEEFRQTLLRLRALPGVLSVSAVSSFLIGGGANDTIGFEGRPPLSAGEAGQLHSSGVTPDFFRTLGVPLLRGRYLNAVDEDLGIRLIWGHKRVPVLRPGLPNAEPVVVNQAFVRRFLPGEEPLGKRFYEGQLMGGGKHYWYEIVGVVSDMRRQGLDRQAIPEYFVTLKAVQNDATLAIRTGTDPLALASAVRDAIRDTPGHPVVQSITTAERSLAELSAERRFQTWLLALFAGVALVLSAIGIFGVMHYAVAQRTHEIGIRMALGAGPAKVRGLVLGQGLGMTMVGVGAGMVVSFWLTQLLRGVLFEVSATDPFAFVAAPAILTFAAALACYLPAR
jgi:predicted permease